MWLEELQDLAYDLDDLLDELATEALCRKPTMAQPTQASNPSMFQNLITNPVYFARAVQFDLEISSKIDNITGRLDDLLETKSKLNLMGELVGGTSLRRTRDERPPSTSLVDKYCGFYGREKDKQAILAQMRLGCESGRFLVIPIVGMGGIGKTTLAQEIYNDEEVKNSFDLKAWICVSDEFEEFAITQRIYEAISSKSCKFKDLNMVQVKLQEMISNQKFLLVLDDVWNENYRKWDDLSRPFQAGAPGSTVIVTTRNVGVASIMGSVPNKQLEQLGDEEICSILAHHAHGWQNFDAHPGFKETREAIAKKCKGLPLAAKSLGGLLRTKENPNEWKDVLDSKIWDIPKGHNDVLPALRLSYHHLPSHLKRLFAYCSLFPKDYEFDKHELVLLWTAEGFLRPSETHREMEDVGFRCFDELLSRSFFQRSKTDAESRFVMHDLVNDLARHVAGRVSFRLEDEAESNVQHRMDSLLKARHSSFIRHKYDGYQRFEAFSGVSKLRTFLPLPVFKTKSWEPFYLTNQVVNDLLPQLHFVRVLSLSGYLKLQLPNAIGNLKHLRYLNVSGTRIVQLPETVSELYNLQTLLLRDCKSLTKLPTDTRNLINLRHLDIAGTEELKKMPVGLCKMASLQTLSKIVLGRGLKVNELRDLSNLRGVLSIIGLQCVMDAQDAREANLTSKQGLEELEMVWSSDFDDSRNGMIEREVIELLKPSTNLRRLKVKHYGGVEFPSWLGDPSFSQLAHMSLSECRHCTSLPSLGQLPSLKKLHISGIKGVKTVGKELCGVGGREPPVGDAFPSLETLEFVDMS
ncbi:hypothetical protein RJ640_020536 [Escallonia rubra]|uniref:Disease resistance RPP13-like protein 1 n=1 Tax=Escallonia rubra TaxID=112253 RepID=A0AA88QV77_9ASTE|nr:hypothetical protein RJ640_020536 [Escallonia rubra]